MKAPDALAFMFCPANFTAPDSAIAAAAGSETKGGAITTSMSMLEPSSREKLLGEGRGLARPMFIFQFAATIGLRVISSILLG